MDKKAPPIVVDLGLCEWVEIPFWTSEKKLIEEKHQQLHKQHISHIHIDGSLDRYPD